MNEIILNANQDEIFNSYAFGGPINPEMDEGQFEYFLENVPDDYVENIWTRVIQRFSPQLGELRVRLYWQRDWDMRANSGLIQYTGGERVAKLAFDMEVMFSHLIDDDVDRLWDTENARKYYMGL